MDQHRADPGSWRDWLPAVLLAFVASRLVLLVVVALVEASLGWPYSRDTYSATPLVGGLTGLDALYYLGIAAGGYHLEPVHRSYHDWVFFPAFPVLSRIVSPLALGDVALAGVVVSNGLLLAGLAAVAALMRPLTDRDTLGRTMLLVAFAPGAVAFGMAYSDSLLLAASAGALLAARHRRTWLMGMLLALASLTRPPGILLTIPLAIELWPDRGRLGWAGWLPFALGPLALAAFAAYQGVVLGDALAFLHGQGAWNLASITAPPSGVGSENNPGYVSEILPLIAILLGTLLAYTAMLPGLVRSHLPRAEVALALIAFATVFLSGRLQSDARYLAVAWPFAWYLASRREPFRGAWLALSVSGYVVLAFLNVTQVLAA